METSGQTAYWNKIIVKFSLILCYFDKKSDDWKGKIMYYLF